MCVCPESGPAGMFFALKASLLARDPLVQWSARLFNILASSRTLLALQEINHPGCDAAGGA